MLGIKKKHNTWRIVLNIKVSARIRVLYCAIIKLRISELNDTSIHQQNNSSTNPNSQ